MVEMKIICAALLISSITLVSGQGYFMNSYLERQLQCALDRAPCDYYGYQIKRSLPFLMNNAQCKQCDPSKMSNAQLLASYIQMRYPEIWNELMIKYGMRNRTPDTNKAYRK